MAKKIWFGIPGQHMQWCPAPLAGGQASNVNHVEQIAFENGGADVVRSKQYRKQYAFTFNALVKDAEGIGVYNKFASGFYGDGLVLFSDPFAWESNVVPAGWASPGLIEQGWENIVDVAPTFADTAANVHSLPKRSAVFNPGVVANAVPATGNGVLTIPIPPTHTLHLGVSGSATGTGVVRVVPINTDGTSASAVDLTLLSTTSATRMNTTFAGSSYQAVRVYITNTSTTPSTVTIASMMGQIYKTGTSPVLPSTHFHGEGHTGLMFADEARVETYTYIDPPRKGLSTTLVEVGAWR